MDIQLDYDNFPAHFMHCLNERCPRAEECLRRKAALLMSVDRVNVPVLNPLLYEQSGGEGCCYFFSIVPERHAKGFLHMLDNIPRVKGDMIKRQMVRYFGRTIYYRCLHGERLIKPAEQADIEKIFLRNGLQEKPVYDAFVDQYDF